MEQFLRESLRNTIFLYGKSQYFPEIWTKDNQDKNFFFFPFLFGFSFSRETNFARFWNWTERSWFWEKNHNHMKREAEEGKRMDDTFLL